MDRWLRLVRRLMEVNLSDVLDTLQWKLSRSGVFSVKSMYTDLINTGTIPRTVHIWKVKVPLKIKVFMWFVHKGVILTKDNLAKRNWEGSKRCCFCDKDETIEHLFVNCPLAKLLWRTIHVSLKLHLSRYHTCLITGWPELSQSLRRISEWEHVHYFGLCGPVAMTLPLTDKPSLIFCRSSSERLLGFVHDHYSAMRTTGSIWILGASDGRWLHGIHTTGLDGGLIIG